MIPVGRVFPQHVRELMVRPRERLHPDYRDEYRRLVKDRDK